MKKKKLSFIEKCILKRLAVKLDCDIDGDMYNVIINIKENKVAASRLPGKVIQ